MNKGKMTAGKQTGQKKATEKRTEQKKAAEKRTGQKKTAKESGKKEYGGLRNTRYRDSSGKVIFEDPVLCAQFLRDYVDIGIPMMREVQPEDIEDVTERFVHMFTEERESDVIKRVHFENNSFYLISLIEHKSDIDYNTIMQVFRYIAFIWEDYEKEMERAKPGVSTTKGFCYPPVLPIIFYDGPNKWTAATSLHERVQLSDTLGRYIPDYHCILIQLNDYSNAELMEKKDELSMLLLMDKLRNASDYEALGGELTEDFLKEVTKDSPEYLLKLMSQIIGIFLSRLNVPEEEADAFTERIKERKMGELFKHFEGWDVQALRQEVADAKEETEKIKEKAKEEIKRERETGIQKFFNSIKRLHATSEEAVRLLMEEYSLSAEEAEEKIALYW